MLGLILWFSTQSHPAPNGTPLCRTQGSQTTAARVRKDWLVKHKHNLETSMLVSGFRQLSGLLPQASSCAGLAAIAARGISSFRAQDLQVEKSPRTGKPQLPENLAFGQLFTDHMLICQHTDAAGWSPPTIQPFGPLSMHPASQVLHYGMCCFEGMKAYLGADGRGRLFRPDKNMERLARSSGRLLLARFDPQELLDCMKQLLRLDRAWLPERPGHSIYIRPYMFASDTSLGVHKTNATTLAVIMSPVGPYFKTGATPVKLFLDTAHVRAWPGGPGAFKVGGNYAPTVLPQVQAAQAHGCSQVAYALPQGDNPDDAVISECGAMNLFFVFEQPQSGSSSSGGGSLELVTPPLDGTILPGITRDSILQLAARMPGVTVSERQLTIGQLRSAAAAGHLREVFGSGTACVVQPVGALVLGAGKQLQPRAASQQGGQQPWLWQHLLQTLTDIQYGRVEHEWSVPFE